MQTFCTTKQCIQNRGSAGEDLWSQQCGNPGYQAKKKHVEMTSKWRASFTFHRSLDCSCRLLCWASSSAPSAANKIHTTTLRDNCNTTCSFFFFASTHLFYGLIIFYILACLYWENFSRSRFPLPPPNLSSPLHLFFVTCSHFLFCSLHWSTKNSSTSEGFACCFCSAKNKWCPNSASS